VDRVNPADDSRGHRRWREMLGAYALGELDDERRAALQAHLDGCEECRAELREIEPAGAPGRLPRGRMMKTEETSSRTPGETGHDLIRTPAGRIAGEYPKTGGGSREGSDLGLGSTEVNRVSS
jgi:hypothetical protein